MQCSAVRSGAGDVIALSHDAAAVKVAFNSSSWNIELLYATYGTGRYGTPAAQQSLFGRLVMNANRNCVLKARAVMNRM